MAIKKKGEYSDKLRKALDEAMPMGVHASLHQNPGAVEAAFTRKADQGSIPLSMGTQAGSSFVSRTPMLYVDPMFDPILFLFPKDRIDEINKRLRHYYETDPIIGSAIDMHCLPAGEPVYCNGSVKNIEDIAVGDYVIGTSGASVRVTGTESTQYNGLIYDIKPMYLPAIRVTDTHPIMVIPKDAILYDRHGTRIKTDANRPHFSNAKWLSASNIREGDIVLFPKFNLVAEQGPVDMMRYVRHNDKYVYNDTTIHAMGKDDRVYRRHIQWGEEFAEFLGWYVAEGSVSGSTVTLSLGSHEVGHIARIRHLVFSLFGLDTSVYEKNNNGTQIAFFSTPIADTLSGLCGSGCENKMVPDGVVMGSKSVAQAFLSAYLHGDGCLAYGQDDVRQVQCVTTSRTLAYQLLLIGSKCGILFGYTAPTFAPRHGKAQQYKLTAHKASVGAVVRETALAIGSEPFPENYKTNEFFHQDDSYFYLPVRRVGTQEFSGIVYDIKTEDSSFCAPFLVHNTSFPLSDYYLECENRDNQEYWNNHKDRTGQLEFLRQMVHDHWLLGEGIGLPIWDEYNMEFSHYNQYPPENVDIVQSYVTPRKYFMLKPDPKLADKIKSSAKLDEALTKMMDPAYVQSLQENKAFLLGSDEKVMYLARNTTKYRARGVSLLSRALKDLLYKDKLRLLQLTIVDRHMTPIKIFKLGSESKGWIPNKKHFQRLDALLKQAANDPDFNILYHFGLSVEYVGTKDKIWNLTAEFDWIEKQVMAALFVNEEIVHGGMPSAVRDTVNMRTLMYRYMDVREKIERMMITHIFLPTARARGMYRQGRKADFVAQEQMLKRIAGKDVYLPGEFLDKEKKMFRVANSHCGAIDLSVYDIPRPIWKKLNLVNNAAEQSIMAQLESDGKLPLEMLYDMLGIDPRTVKTKMEAQESTMFDPLWRQNREAVGQDKNIRLQILHGKKHGEWVGEADTLEDAGPSGSKPAPKRPSAPPMLGGGGGGAPPPAPKKEEKPAGPPNAGAAPPPPRPPVSVKPPAGGTPGPAMTAPGPVPGAAPEAK